MSIKIYNAFRMTPSVFEKKFLPAFRNHAFEYAKDIVEKLVSSTSEDTIKNVIEEKSIEFKNRNIPFNAEEYLLKNKEYVKVRYVLESLQKISVQPRINPADIDASMNVWFYKSKFYVIIYGNCANTFLMPKNVEEYHYQNSTDKPRNISEIEWEERYQNWKHVCIDNHNQSRMVHEVINAKIETGLFEILKLMNTENWWKCMPMTRYSYQEAT